jgi:hypothetical protein
VNPIFAAIRSSHLTSAILAGLGAVFVLAGLVYRWASGRATGAAITGDWTRDATRAAAGCATDFLSVALGACAVALLVAGGIAFLAGH